MSKNTGFSDTSANRYSLALYELASESNSLSKIEENSHALLKLISNSKDFNDLIKDPTISRDILNHVIKNISDNFSLEVLFKNFLSFLIAKKRFFYVRTTNTSSSTRFTKRRYTHPHVGYLRASDVVRTVPCARAADRVCA